MGKNKNMNCCCLVTMSCPAVCNPMDCCMLGFHVLHYLPEFSLSMGFSWQEYWSGVPFPPPRDLPDPGIEPASLSLLLWQVDSLPLAPLGKPDSEIIL